MPILIAHLGQRPVSRDTGIIDQHIDLADLFGDLAAPFLAGIKIADIPFCSGDPGARCELARPFVIAAIIGDHRHPLVFQRNADRFADPACATGYNRHSRHALILLCLTAQ